MKSDKTLEFSELFWQPNKDKAPVLDSLNGCFTKGGFYGIIGPNGSGKTSLMRYILRFLDIKNGSVTLEGKNIYSYKRNEFAKNIALVPQNINSDVQFTVFDIVMMGRTPYQKKFSPFSENDLKIVTEALELTDCIELKDKVFSSLSGGEAQRVITARTLAQQTPWIVLDEPTAHLDVKHQLNLMETLKKLNTEKQVTIIAVLHDLNLASSYCQNIFLMKSGKIFAQGTTNDVLTKENLKAVYELDFEVAINPQNAKKYYIPFIN